jgi:putative DNA primase/helicase
MTEIKGATPEMARLLGKRMVTVSETEENDEIRESVLKSLSGGDTLTARMLYKDYFSFAPTHKLQLFTNHKPKIRGQDRAIWRRLLLVNYPVRYGDAQEIASGEANRLKDKDLGAALRLEAPGILRWLVEGAKMWYESGLQEPEAVIAATIEYKQDQDIVGKFVRERVIHDPESRVPIMGGLYTAYRGWCDSVNHRPYSRDRFLNEIRRLLPNAQETSWVEGTRPVSGFAGIKLTEDTFN